MMGAIMSIGVATANSILLVNFANDLREEGLDAMSAALEAGYTRLRPVTMTALAMIVGMLPMALGMGEGGEQNAPLGRAVIGGLLLATIATLFFVPVVYSVLRREALPSSAAIRASRKKLVTARDGASRNATKESGHPAPPDLLRGSRGRSRGGHRRWLSTALRPSESNVGGIGKVCGPAARSDRLARSPYCLERRHRSPRRPAGANRIPYLRPRRWLYEAASGRSGRPRQGR